MIIHTFSLIFSLLLVGGNSPNYYPNYMSAREASKTNHKELVVFFMDNSCNTCESAWSAFTNDPVSSQQYVCTRLDIRDFDGGVFFNHFEFKQVPAWVILTPDAEVRQKWEGGWKDSNSNPILYDANVTKSMNKEEKKITAPTQNSPPSQNEMSSNTYKESKATSTKTIPEKSLPAIVETKLTTPTLGFVLQAGYFGSEMNAKKMMDELKIKGLSSFKIETVDKDGSTYYRVITNAYSSESDVVVEQEHLSSIGVKTAVKQL